MHPELFIERNVAQILTAGGVFPGCGSLRDPGGLEDVLHHAVFCKGAGICQVSGGGKEDGQVAAAQAAPAGEGRQEGGQTDASEEGEPWVR